MTGWKCPGCGACFSPSTTECRHCAPAPRSNLPIVCTVHDFDSGGRCLRCGFQAVPVVTSSAVYRPSLGVEMAGHVTSAAT